MTLDTFRRLLNGDIDLNSRIFYQIRAMTRAMGADGNAVDEAPPEFEMKGKPQALAADAGLPPSLIPRPTGGAAGRRFNREEFFPGLPFDAVMVAEHIQRDEVTSPFKPDELLGMSARQFIGSATGRAKRELGQIRKLGKQLTTQPLPEDLLALCVGAGLHTRRQMLVLDFLNGKSAPIIEFRLIDHWMKLAGRSLPKANELMLSGDMVEGGGHPGRLVVMRQYQEMLLPILADLRQLPRATQVDPDARAWALFNAWWAIASLYCDAGIIRDVSPLWPEAASLFAIASGALYGIDGTLSLTVTDPAYPTAGHEEFEFLRTFSKAGATTPDLLLNWDILEEQVPELIDGFDALVETRRQREALFERQRRDSILSFYCRYRRLAGASLFERLENLSATVGYACDDLAALTPLTTHFAEIEHSLENAGDNAGVDVFTDPHTPASLDVVAAMVTWMHDANILCNAIEMEVGAWDERLCQAAETQGTLVERMAATQRAGEQFAQWQTESQEALAEMIERATELPWSGVMAIDLRPAEEAPAAAACGEASDDADIDSEERIQILEEERAKFENQMKHHRHRAWALQQLLDRAQASQSDDAAPDTGGLVAALRAFSDSTSCPNVLRLLQAAHPGRLRVLPSAFDSASDADSSLSATGLLRKAHALVMEGWEILADNRPPYDMQEVIPGDLALNESDSTRQDARCMQQRTFQEKHDDGTVISWEMSWHLKLDHRHRLYFAWDEQAQQLVIGHAGAHLGLAAIRS